MIEHQKNALVEQLECAKETWVTRSSLASSTGIKCISMLVLEQREEIEAMQKQIERLEHEEANIQDNIQKCASQQQIQRTLVKYN